MTEKFICRNQDASQNNVKAGEIDDQVVDYIIVYQINSILIIYASNKSVATADSTVELLKKKWKWNHG